MEGKVSNFLNRLLKVAFPTIATKQSIRTYSNRINFACPVCGDSTHDHNKKRGNLYDNYTYKCYNCGHTESFSSFVVNMCKVYNFSHEFSETELSLFGKKYKEFIASNISNRGKHIDPTEDFGLILQIGIPRALLMKRCGFVNVSENKKAYAFLKSRGQISREVDLLRFAYCGYRDAVVIFNSTPDGGRIFGLQFRYFKGKIKYQSQNYESLLGGSFCNIENVSSEVITRGNSVSLIFNLFRLDFDSVITVFEGPLDANLFYNSIATAGANSHIFGDMQLRFFQDNDMAGRKLALNRLGMGDSVFMWKKFLSDYPIKAKDLGEIYEQIPIDSIDWDLYFSSSGFDSIYV